MMPAAVDVVRVPRLWPGQAVAILASGPSLAPTDVASVAAAGLPIIAIKEAQRLAPAADVLYACDAKWWKHFGPTLRFDGLRYALEPTPYALTLRNTGMTGLETDPTGLRTGKNSGYQAINLAVHLGAAKIILLGFDMQPGKTGDHFFGAHRYPGAVEPRYYDFLQCFGTIAAPLAAAGVEVVNATPDSALHAFPHVTLEEALA
jgi:hypothetical protein